MNVGGVTPKAPDCGAAAPQPPCLHHLSHKEVEWFQANQLSQNMRNLYKVKNYILYCIPSETTPRIVSFLILTELSQTRGSDVCRNAPINVVVVTRDSFSFGNLIADHIFWRK